MGRCTSTACAAWAPSRSSRSSRTTCCTAARRTARNDPERSPARHPAQRFRPPVRRSHRCRPHLLLAPGGGTGGGYGVAARLHRAPHLRGRPPHGVPARPFRVRPGERQPAVRVVIPPLASLLQLGAVEPALRAPRRDPGLRSSRPFRIGPRRVRAGGRGGLGRLPPASSAAEVGHPPPPF